MERELVSLSKKNCLDIRKPLWYCVVLTGGEL